MGPIIGQETGVAVADVCRFYIKYRQVVLATTTAPLAALEPILVKGGQGLDLPIYEAVKPGEGLQ